MILNDWTWDHLKLIVHWVNEFKKTPISQNHLTFKEVKKSKICLDNINVKFYKYGFALDVKIWVED